MEEGQQPASSTGLQLDVNDFPSTEVEPTTPAESSPEETPAPETEEAPVEVEPKEEGEETPAVEPEEDAPKRGAEARKDNLNQEIRELVAKRTQLRTEVETLQNQHYRTQTAEELIEEGYEPLAAKVEALEQATSFAAENQRITELNSNVDLQSLQVMNDFPIFNPNSSEYNKEVADRASSLYQQIAGITTDEKTGLINQVSVMPYNIYKTIAETHQASASTAKVTAQRSAEKMLAAADTPSSSAPKQAPQDDFLKGLTRRN